MERSPEKYKKRAREKGTKRNLEALRQRKAEVDTQKSSGRQQKRGARRCACMHPPPHQHQHLCCVGVPPQDPHPADPKLSTVRMQE